MTFGSATTRLQKGISRDRIFERIRATGSMPRRRHLPDGAPDLIERVDLHPQFRGTRAISDAELWLMLSDKQPSPVSTRAHLKVICKRLKLLRDPNDNLWWGATERELRNGSPRLREYKERTALLFLRLELNLDLIGLLVALYREAYFAAGLEVALFLQGLITVAVESFTKVDWMQPVGSEFGSLVDLRTIEMIGPELHQIYGDCPWDVVGRPLMRRVDRNEWARPRTEVERIGAIVDRAAMFHRHP